MCTKHVHRTSLTRYLIVKLAPLQRATCTLLKQTLYSCWLFCWISNLKIKYKLASLIKEIHRSMALVRILIIAVLCVLLFSSKSLEAAAVKEFHDWPTLQYDLKNTLYAMVDFFASWYVEKVHSNGFKLLIRHWLNNKDICIGQSYFAKCIEINCIS